MLRATENKKNLFRFNRGIPKRKIVNWIGLECPTLFIYVVNMTTGFCVFIYATTLDEMKRHELS